MGYMQNLLREVMSDTIKHYTNSFIKIQKLPPEGQKVLKEMILKDVREFELIPKSNDSDYIDKAANIGKRRQTLEVFEAIEQGISMEKFLLKKASEYDTQISHLKGM
jgi:hypothetical protein